MKFCFRTLLVIIRRYPILLGASMVLVIVIVRFLLLLGFSWVPLGDAIAARQRRITAAQAAAITAAAADAYCSGALSNIRHASSSFCQLLFRLRGSR